MWEEFSKIRRRLDELASRGELEEYIEYRLFDMTKKVLGHITEKYDNLRKGARSIVGGRILDYPAKTVFEQGISQGIIQTLASLVKDGILSVKEAAARGKMTEAEFRSQIRML